MCKVFSQDSGQKSGVSCETESWHCHPRLEALLSAGLVSQLLTIFPSLRNGCPCRELATEQIPMGLGLCGNPLSLGTA